MVSLVHMALPRESEKRNTELYEDLPLFMIEERFGGTEGGRKLGLNHPIYLVQFRTCLCFVLTLLVSDPRAYIAQLRASLQLSFFGQATLE